MVLAFLAFFPFIGAVLCYMTGRRNKALRDAMACAVCTLELIASCLLLIRPQQLVIPGLFGLGLSFAADGLRSVLSILASIIFLGSTLYAHEYFRHSVRRNRYYLFMLMTLGATQGVFLSDDLYTAFIFFEMMSLTSWVLVKQEETPAALRAGQTYLAVSIAAGLVTLTGLFMAYASLGTLRFDEITTAALVYPDKARLYWMGILLLCGFAAKAGMFPLHVWLPEAHPAAPAPASALLSCILTKTGVFGILVISCRLFPANVQWGITLLVPAAITMLLGAVLAIMAVDLKRVLACSSLSQIGFVLVGVSMQCLLGEENVLACAGTIAHIVNHALIKLVLFTCAGVVYTHTHRLNLNDIRGFGRGKPLLMLCFLSGALSIAGIPGMGGYISKTLLHESILEYSGAWNGLIKTVEWVFIISGGLTLAYMTKLFVAIFVEKGDHPVTKERYTSPLTASVLVITALTMPIFGLLPHLTLDAVAEYCAPFMGAGSMHKVAYFAWANLKGAVISIGIGALVYLLVVRGMLVRNGRYINGQPAWLSLENRVYRPLVTNLLPRIGGAVAAFVGGIVEFVLAYLHKWVFNKDEDRATPPIDPNFSVYPEEPFLRRGFTDTLAFSFLLLGIGLVVTLLYLIFG